MICDKIANIVGSRISLRNVQRRPKSWYGQPGITAHVQAACGGHRIQCRSRQACIHKARAAEVCAAGTSKYEVHQGQRKKQEEGVGASECEQRQRRPALRPAQLKCGSVLPATRHAGTATFREIPLDEAATAKSQRCLRHQTTSTDRNQRTFDATHTSRSHLSVCCWMEEDIVRDFLLLLSSVIQNCV